MEPETWSSGASEMRITPSRRSAGADAPAPERHWWAIAALFLPLVFCAIVGVGVFLMFHRQMGYFKPAPSSSAASGHALAAGADVAPGRRTAGG